MELCNDCPKLLKNEVMVVSVWGMHFCVPCYIKRLEEKYSCAICHLPFRGREKTAVVGGVLVHEACQ